MKLALSCLAAADEPENQGAPVGEQGRTRAPPRNPTNRRFVQLDGAQNGAAKDELDGALSKSYFVGAAVKAALAALPRAMKAAWAAAFLLVAGALAADPPAPTELRNGGGVVGFDNTSYVHFVW